MKLFIWLAFICLEEEILPIVYRLALIFFLSNILVAGRENAAGVFNMVPCACFSLAPVEGNIGTVTWRVLFVARI